MKRTEPRKECVTCGRLVRERSTPDEHAPGCEHGDAPSAPHPASLRAALDEVRECDEAALDNLDAMLDVAGREATWGTLPATARALRAVAALVRAARETTRCELCGRDGTCGEVICTEDKPIRITPETLAAKLDELRVAAPAPHPGDVRPCGACKGWGFVKGHTQETDR